MALNYRSKLFGGGPGGGSGVGTSLTTQVLFNNAGVVAGDSGLTYDAGTDTLTVAAAGAGFIVADNVTAKHDVVVGSVAGDLRLGDARVIKWHTSGATGATDSGLRRVSAGLVGVTDGSTGWGALRASNLDDFTASSGMGYTAGSGSYGFHLASDSSLTWSQTLSYAGAVHVALDSPSTGLLRVTSGGSNLGGLQAGNLTATALGTPTVTSPLTVNGTPGATTYGYKAVAFLNDGTSSAASAEVTVATGPATLNATDNITVAVPAVSNMAYMNIYRTTGGTAPPKLIYSGTSPSYIDMGTEISASTPPSINTTGRVLVGDGSITVPSVAAISEPGTGIFIAAGDLNLVSAYGKVNVRTAAVNLDSDRDYRIANDTFLTRADAATWQMGRAPRATPLANTLIVGESGSGTDIPGANGVIQSGAGTGAGAGSTLFLKTPVNHGSDAVAQTQVTRMSMSQYGITVDAVPLFGPVTSDQIDLGLGSNVWRNLYVTRGTLGSKSKALTDATPTAFATFTIADGEQFSGEIIWAVKSVDGTNKQIRKGRTQFTASREGAAYDFDAGDIGTSIVSAATGTLTTSISINCTGGVCTLSADANSSQTTPVLTLSYRFDSTDAALAITPL